MEPVVNFLIAKVEQLVENHQNNFTQDAQEVARDDFNMETEITDPQPNNTDGSASFGSDVHSQVNDGGNHAEALPSSFNSFIESQGNESWDSSSEESSWEEENTDDDKMDSVNPVDGISARLQRFGFSPKKKLLKSWDSDYYNSKMERKKQMKEKKKSLKCLFFGRNTKSRKHKTGFGKPKSLWCQKHEGSSQKAGLIWQSIQQENAGQ